MALTYLKWCSSGFMTEALLPTSSNPDVPFPHKHNQDLAAILESLPQEYGETRGCRKSGWGEPQIVIIARREAKYVEHCELWLLFYVPGQGSGAAQAWIIRRSTIVHDPPRASTTAFPVAAIYLHIKIRGHPQESSPCQTWRPFPVQRSLWFWNTTYMKRNASRQGQVTKPWFNLCPTRSDVEHCPDNLIESEAYSIGCAIKILALDGNPQDGRADFVVGNTADRSNWRISVLILILAPLIFVILAFNDPNRLEIRIYDQHMRNSNQI
ncbi:hypothetical protein DFH09DRAFT_1086542 [Mycena vulgaris]|nr:hypothetical protein DFH09DRAFT_1086542 [Mycena vulgaris]